jgi:two-component system, NtrC family, response regulator HydG
MMIRPKNPLRQLDSGGNAKLHRVIGRSFSMRRVMAQVEQLAASPASILIAGETGTGKEIMARALHERSARRDGPFIAINCAALPEGLGVMHP